MNSILPEPGQPSAHALIPTQTPHGMQEDPACNEPVVKDSSYPLNSRFLRHA